MLFLLNLVLCSLTDCEPPPGYPGGGYYTYIYNYYQKSALPVVRG